MSKLFASITVHSRRISQCWPHPVEPAEDPVLMKNIEKLSCTYLHSRQIGLYKGKAWKQKVPGRYRKSCLLVIGSQRDNPRLYLHRCSQGRTLEGLWLPVCHRATIAASLFRHNCTANLYPATSLHTFFCNPRMKERVKKMKNWNDF